MSLKKRIDEDLKAAMREQNKDNIRALRGIKSQILLAETEKGAAGDLSGDAEIALLVKAAKQRKDSAALYHEQGRADLAQIEEAELAIISNYLPRQLTEQELRDYLKDLVAELGAKGPQDMGKVMGKANQQLKGKADGSTIAKIVKSLLLS